MMKKAVLLTLLLSSALFAELNWAKSYKAGLAQAQKEQKMVMVMFSQDGCPACEYMKDIVFDEDAVVDEVHMDFVPVHIDIHSDVKPDGLRYAGTPTFHFLTSDGKRIDRLDGGANI